MCLGQADLPFVHSCVCVCVFVKIYDQNTANCNHLLKAEVCISSYVILHPLAHTHAHTHTHTHTYRHINLPEKVINIVLESTMNLQLFERHLSHTHTHTHTTHTNHHVQANHEPVFIYNQSQTLDTGHK